MKYQEKRPQSNENSACKQFHNQTQQQQQPETETEAEYRQIQALNEMEELLLKNGFFGSPQSEFLYTFVATLLETAQQGDEFLLYQQQQQQTCPTTTSNLFSCDIDVSVIDLFSYAERISRFSFCSPECYVMCLVYIDRIIQFANFNVTNQNIHKILLTGILVAAKFFDEHYLFDNAYFARVGGISTVEINQLEIEFLKLIDYRLHVLPHEFTQYKDSILTSIHINSTLDENDECDHMRNEHNDGEEESNYGELGVQEEEESSRRLHASHSEHEHSESIDDDDGDDHSSTDEYDTNDYDDESTEEDNHSHRQSELGIEEEGLLEIVEDENSIYYHHCLGDNSNFVYSF